MRKAAAFLCVFLHSLLIVFGQLPTEGLLAFYPLNGNARDASGNGHDGIVHGTTPTANRFGKAGSALYFSNSWIEIPDTPTLRPHNFTYSFWYSTLLPAHAPTFVFKPRGSGMPASFGVWMRANSIQTYVTLPGGETYLKSPLWIPDKDAWHHIAVSGNYPSREYQIWVDGACFAQVALNVENTYDDQPWIIGAARQDNKLTAFLFGNLDDLRFYNRALGEAEIHALAAEYPGGKPVSSDWMRPALPDGRYVVLEAENNGVPNKRPRKIELTGQLPLWHRPWFVAVFLSILFGLFFGLLRLRQWQRERLRRLELDKWKTLEAERGRIARDLHDDLGSGLSAISLLSEVARQKSEDSPVDEEIRQLAAASHELSVKIREIIWMVSARNDRLDYLVSYLGNYVVERFEHSPVELNLRLPEAMPPTLVGGERRRALFQAVKEALHLVAAQRTGGSLLFAFSLNNAFEVLIEWDGGGISAKEIEQATVFQQVVKKLIVLGGGFSSNVGAVVQWRFSLPV